MRRPPTCSTASAPAWPAPPRAAPTPPSRGPEATGSADEDEIAAIVAELREHEVTRETVEAAQAHVRRATGALDALPPGTVREALREFAERLVNRDF